MEVGNSTMLYGSEIWAEMLNVEKRANSVISAQRTAILLIASAYFTVSAPAVLVIAVTIPVDPQNLLEITYPVTPVKTEFQNGNDDGTMNIEEGGRLDLSWT